MIDGTANFVFENWWNFEKMREGCLTQSSGFTFRFHKTQNVIFSDWTFDVSDNGSGRVINEFNTDLGDTTSGTGST